MPSRTESPRNVSSTGCQRRKNLKVGEDYLKALCKIPLPRSNMIALSDLEEARWRVSLDLMWR
jgi:hypothetical protein